MDEQKMPFGKLKKILDEIDKRKDTKYRRFRFKVAGEEISTEKTSLSDSGEKLGNSSGCTDWNCGDDVAGNVSSCDGDVCDPPIDDKPGNSSACNDWNCGEQMGNSDACTDWNCGDDVAGNVSSCDGDVCDPPVK